MEWILAFLDFLNSIVQTIDVRIFMVAIMTAGIYFAQVVKKNQNTTTDHLKRIEKTQDEMRAEYQEGLQKLSQELERQQQATEASLQNLEKQQRENKLMTLRSIVTNSALPKEYRMQSYDAYSKEGGNSWLEEYFNKVLKND